MNHSETLRRTRSNDDHVQNFRIRCNDLMEQNGYHFSNSGNGRQEPSLPAKINFNASMNK